jgi:hypothetical protein
MIAASQSSFMAATYLFDAGISSFRPADDGGRVENRPKRATPPGGYPAARRGQNGADSGFD